MLDIDKSLSTDDVPGHAGRGGTQLASDLVPDSAFSDACRRGRKARCAPHPAAYQDAACSGRGERDNAVETMMKKTSQRSLRPRALMSQVRLVRVLCKLA